LCLLAASCHQGDLPPELNDGRCAITIPREHRDIQVAGWPNREYDLFLPVEASCTEGVDLIVMFHGGGADKTSAQTITCPDGNSENPLCLQHQAMKAGFMIATPNGTRAGSLLPRIRTWNAGGGTGAFTCVSGNACTDNVDDVAYFSALLDSIASRIKIRNVFLTGISNGGAMSYRLACVDPRVKAIAPVSGQNQYITSATCAPAKPVSLISFHGTSDPCWPLAGGAGNCISPDVYISANASITNWATLNQCNLTPSSSVLPDTAADGMTVQREVYDGCKSNSRLEFYRINNGGHRWPGGYEYPSIGINVGDVPRDIDASAMILQFFRKQ